jgi:hypothetical protein
MPEFIRQMTGDISAIIIDRRDSPIVAKNIEKFLIQNRFDTHLVFITMGTVGLLDRQDGSIVVNDGKDLIARLRSVMPLALAHKRGPKKGSHRRNVRSEEVSWNPMLAVS